MSSTLAAQTEARSSYRRVHWNPFLVQHLRISEHICNLNFVERMARLFYLHGKFCASHPWEVMVTFLSLAICMFTMGPYMLFDQSQGVMTTHSPSVAPSQFYFSHMDSSPHLTPDPFKNAANFVSDDPISQNRYFRYGHNDQRVRDRTTCSSSECSTKKGAFPSSATTVPHGHSNGLESSEVVILTISRCLALLYVYHQFRNLYKLGSKYLVGIAGLFTVFSSFIFCSGVVNFLNGNLTVLNKALPFFILLSDFSKASLLAQFALSSSTKEEIHENIARGMATLGPSLTLDTLVETLAIGMGTITGFPRLEEISYFSCMTYLVNYVVFMTFFPAALALALELAHDREGVEAPVWQFASLTKVLQLETEHTPNPVIQRVKVVMSAGLMLVHTLRRWPSLTDGNEGINMDYSNPSNLGSSSGMPSSSDQSNGLFGSLNFSTSTGTEQILVIGFVCVLTIKYIFFENKDNLDMAQNTKYSKIFRSDSVPDEHLSDSKEMLKDENDSTSGVSETYSETSSSTPSSTRPTTPTTTSSSTAGDDLDNSTRLGKPATPSILITTQDSDTESAIAEYRRKLSESRMLLSSVNSSNASSRASSMKGLCVNHRNHHAAINGHGSVTDESSMPSLSECEEGSDHSQSTSPSFFIGDDCCSECYSSDATEYVDREVQTDFAFPSPPELRCTRALSDDHERQLYVSNNEADQIKEEHIRDLAELQNFLKQEDGCKNMNDSELQYLVEKQLIPAYKLESILGDPQKGVAIRRRVIESSAGRLAVLKDVPYIGYDYHKVLGACCENVIGYLPLPLGVAGPLLLNGREFFVPMATTEGCLVASTNRGCRAVSLAGGMNATVFADGMTRGPSLHFRTAIEAAEALKWVKRPENFALLKREFDATSRFARLDEIEVNLAGRYLYLRFKARTGDAMGMNMLSKGTERALEELSKHVTGLEMKCLSGNFCTDKKPSAVNWIKGRGKSVVCEAIIPRQVVEKVLKTTVEDLVHFNISKNLIGSAMAGSIGGNNAQAANIVAAIYIATGQDPAQTVGSSNCITLIEPHGNDLWISCTMPSIEIGTIGGGTVLGPQGACLDLLGVKGCSNFQPGSNSSQLAQIVCGTVLTAELSLLAALAAGHLVRSHMKHNRSNINVNQEATPASLLNPSAN